MSLLRGTHVRDISTAPFGVPGWNTGFVSLCALGVLGNADLRVQTSLDDARHSQAATACLWYSTFFLDKRLSRPMVRETLRRIRLPRNIRSHASALLGLRMTVMSRLGLTGWKIRRAARSRAVPVEHILDQLQGLRVIG